MRILKSILIISLACVTFNTFAQGIDTPASALVGQTSGLRISGSDGSLTGDFSATIRGLNSLKGDSSPLIIVDGVMLDYAAPHRNEAFWQERYDSQNHSSPVNLLGFISVDDIESISVLKDVSATAIYGSRGANGVIIIKTKRPRETSPTVEWNNGFGVNSNKGFMHDHYVMVNGSVGRNTFAASLFLNDENDGFSAKNNLRGGSRMTFEAAASENVKFGVSASFAVQQQNSPSTTTLYGAPSMMIDKYQGKDLSGWFNDYDDYIVDYHAIADAHLDISFTRYLSWNTRFGVNYQTNKRYTFYGETTEFGNENRAAAAIVSNSMMNYHAYTELNFNMFAGVDHNVTACLGAEVSGNRNIYNTMNGTDLISPILRAKSLNLAGSKAIISTFKPSYFHLAAYGKVSYDWKHIAGVNATVRVDNTMRYDDAKVLVYPAASAYFDFAKLFTEISGVCQSLKVVGGWGVAGRESIVPYVLFPDYDTAGNYPKLSIGASPVMDALFRQVSSEYNVGLEASLLKDRVGIGVKYYNKKTSSDFNVCSFGLQVPETGKWKYGQMTNVSTSTDVVANRGIEVDVEALAVDTKDIDWSLSATVAFQSNQVAKLSQGSILGGAVAVDGTQANVNAIGYSVGSIYGYDVDASGKLLDHTGDGKVAPEDRIILGRSQPKVFGTFGTTLKLWDASLSALFDGAAGHHLLNMTSMALAGAEHVTAAYVERADFFRLAKLTAAYRIPIRKVKWIDSIGLSLTGYNLCCFTGYSGANPDVDSFLSSNLTRGIDMGAMPMYKAVVLGVDIKF